MHGELINRRSDQLFGVRHRLCQGISRGGRPTSDRETSQEAQRQGRLHEAKRQRVERLLAETFGHVERRVDVSMLCIATPQALEMRLVRSIERQDKATLTALLTGVSWLDTTVANGMFVQFELKPVADVAELVSLQQAVTSSGLETHISHLQRSEERRVGKEC